MAKLAEMDFIVADLERANSRVAAVERRNVCFARLFFAAEFRRPAVCRRFSVLRLRPSEVEMIRPTGALLLCFYLSWPSSLIPYAASSPLKHKFPS